MPSVNMPSSSVITSGVRSLTLRGGQGRTRPLRVTTSPQSSVSATAAASIARTEFAEKVSSRSSDCPPGPLRSDSGRKICCDAHGRCVPDSDVGRSPPTSLPFVRSLVGYPTVRANRGRKQRPQRRHSMRTAKRQKADPQCGNC